MGYCDTLLRELGVNSGKASGNMLKARSLSLGGLPRSNSNPGSALTAEPEHISLRPAVVATSRYNSLVLRPPRSPGVGLAAGTSMAAASTMTRAHSLQGSLQQRRRLTVNKAPPTGYVPEPNYY